MTTDLPEQRTVTANTDSTSFRSREPGVPLPGDLLLVTQIPGEPLGQLMQKLDGTCFSHSGIAVRTDDLDDRPATHLASALAKGLPSGFDFGGVRWDEFSAFWPHRDLWCIPMPDHQGEKALDYLAQFHPEPGREGAFSFAKLVTIAAALRAVELQASYPDLASEMFTAARDVAETLAASRADPSYYCAELVANAYDRTFTRGEMFPPEAEGYGLGNAVDEPRWFGKLMRLFDDEIGAFGGPEWQATTALMDVLVQSDWDFLAAAVRAVAGSGVAALGDVEGGPSVPGPLGPPPALPASLADPDAPIPHGLVTPRMLWAAFGRDTIFRIPQR